MVDIGGGCLEKLNERGWEASVLIFSVSVCIYIFQVAWIPATFLSTKLQKLLCLKKKKIRDTALPLFCLVLLARKVTRTPRSDGEVVFNTTGHSCWPGHQAVGHPHNTFTFYYLPVLLILWLYFFASILYPYSSLHNLLFHFNPFFPFLTNIFNLLIFYLLISSSIYS